MLFEEKESGYIEEYYEYESGDTFEEESPSLPSSVVDERSIRNVVDQQALDIVSNIVATNDSNELSSYLDQFNLNMSKKNLLRILRMNELLDKVSDEALDRIENHPDELTHAELINYIKVTQDSINNSRKGPEQAVPITLNQQNNTVNVNVETSDNPDNIRVDRRSKEKIMEAVSKLLNICLTDDENVVEVIDNSEEENNND